MLAAIGTASYLTITQQQQQQQQHLFIISDLKILPASFIVDMQIEFERRVGFSGRCPYFAKVGNPLELDGFQTRLLSSGMR